MSQPSQPCLYPFEAIKTQTSHEHLILRVPKKRLTLWWVRANTQQPVLTLQFNPDLSSRTSTSQETLGGSSWAPDTRLQIVANKPELGLSHGNPPNPHPMVDVVCFPWIKHAKKWIMLCHAMSVSPFEDTLPASFGMFQVRCCPSSVGMPMPKFTYMPFFRSFAARLWYLKLKWNSPRGGFLCTIHLIKHIRFFALGCFSKALPFHMQYCSLGITVVSSCWLPGILPLLELTKKRSSLLPPNCWWCQPLKSLVVDGHQAKSLVGKAAQPLVSLNITKNIIQENQHLSIYHPVSSPWKISTSHWGSTSHFYGFYLRKPHFDTTSQEKHLHDSWVRKVRSLQCGAP